MSQIRTVAEKPNPPRSGNYEVAMNRPDGYADYRVGAVYVSADAIVELRVWSTPR